MKDQPAKINRAKMPASIKADALSLQEPEEVSLNNGLQAYLINAGDEDVTRLDVVVKAGSAFQTQKLVASTVGKLLREGTSDYSSAEIAARLDYLGSYFDISITKDISIISLVCLTKHLEKLLPLLSQMLSSATFPEHEMQILVEQKRQEYLTNVEKVRYLAMMEFNKLVFGADSAYGQTVEREDFDALEQRHLVDFYNTYYTLDRSYLIVSGRVNNQVLSEINKHLGNGWTRYGQAPDDIQYINPPESQKKYIRRQNAMQSAIRVGRQIINKKHPDYTKFILLNTLLGGYFGSRLMSNLREDKGYTYGISSFTANYQQGAFFSIATEVNADATDAAVAEIFAEMERLGREKIGDAELELVKNYIYGTFLRNFDGPFALAERFRSVRDFGLGFDFYHQSLEEMQSITAEELLETAVKYFGPAQMIQLVVGRKEQ